jgi:hypothetical protein
MRTRRPRSAPVSRSTFAGFRFPPDVIVVAARSHPDRLIVDLTVNASDARHAQAVTDAVEAVPGAHVHKVSDRNLSFMHSPARAA